MLACMSPAPVPLHPPPSLKRPRGLLKQRRQTPATSPHKGTPSHEPRAASRVHSPSLLSPSSLSQHDHEGNDAHDDDDNDVSNNNSDTVSSASSSKRRRLSDISSHAYIAMSISRAASTASSSSTPPKPIHSADYEDWENLKELFAKAAERYDADDIPECLPLLRAVIRQCHRFILHHPDPSLVYTHRDWNDWRRHHTSSELPTAFHAIFGIALFLMGNLVAQDPSIALSAEPDAPSTYWLAALDVFETGENLPSRVGGSDLHTAEDWRMAIVWGRTLVCLADDKVTHAAASSMNSSSRPAAPFSISEPQWPPSSPFHAIAQSRPPVTRRMSLYSASAHDIMVLAMDQFSRGIFHMPHPHYSHAHNPSFIHTSGSSSCPSSVSSTPSHYASPYAAVCDPSVTFSRPKELFTIASEVLGVAERLPSGSQRHYWASWADSVFNQMKNEADMDVWRGPIFSARGRCWLIMGSAAVEDMETALEAGDTEVLHSAEAEEAREGLAMAISFFERAKGQTAGGIAAADAVKERSDDVSPLLVEALLVLANLTADENKREELYTRAQSEAGENMRLDLNAARGDADEAMDTS